MKKIGLLSDTHSFWDEKFYTYFKECDEIWHTGDVGSMEVLNRLRTITVLRAVYGNIDNKEIRWELPETLRFTLEGVDILIKHIGGYPGKYDRSICQQLQDNPPKLFISGHSHLTKVKYDPQLQLLHLNPGAAGVYGFHQVRTLMRFELDKGNIQNLEIIELGNRY